LASLSIVLSFKICFFSKDFFHLANQIFSFIKLPEKYNSRGIIENQASFEFRAK
jgi:hypothetical protein